ncbi:MAG: low molecular weight phosphatase family protein [Candidatus Nanohalobium sp.]
MRLLYICTGNSFRSPVAEALTRKFHPEIEVESAGTDAVGRVAENAERMLEEDEARKYVKPSPDQVSQRAVDEADKVVCMMPEHREFIEKNFDVEEERLEVWNIQDPINPGVSPQAAYRKIKDKIRNLNE